jgi:predicted acylesterase/phospholipase RssA
MEKGLYSYQRLRQECDVLIQPELSSCAVTDFEKIEECFLIGREAGWEALPKLWKFWKKVREGKPVKVSSPQDRAGSSFAAAEQLACRHVNLKRRN